MKPAIKARPKRIVRINAISIAELMVGLQDGCHTMLELAEMSGLAIQTVRRYCQQLHKRGVIHICDWREDKNGGRTLKVFELGPGKDKPKPPRRSVSEVCARWRAKKNHAKMIQRMAANASPFREVA